ncbi:MULTISPECIES: hypothetical protein [Paenibacillus]|uniref:Uncharacterized protein n=1 Tax=Paenibacillus albilobatus TaxID=2716884 RepID=A0A919XBL2_9BACL|nr:MULTISPECIES: hypothetical protein [Paenibacillus]GIO29642.1 hypothetical protein J2TS6_07830 [Paenibacillus albilobatus]
MKKQFTKKIPYLALAGFICAVGIGAPQISSAKQANAASKVVNQQSQKAQPKIEIGQKLRVPELNLKENTYVLDYKPADINGDSVKDQVILVGTKEKIDGKLDAYASNLSVIVQDGKTKKYVKYDWVNKGTDGKLYGELGREPNLIIGDYTGNKVNDIIVTAPQGGNGGFVDHLILTWERNTLKDVLAKDVVADNQELYTNSQANFRLKLPASWKGHYKASQYAGASTNKIMPSAKHVVQFDYTTKDGKDTEMLLMISVFSKNDWNRLSSEQGPPVGSVITEANGMVYVYTTPQSNPFDPQSNDGKLFDQLYGDLNIKNSFELLK